MDMEVEMPTYCSPLVIHDHVVFLLNDSSQWFIFQLAAGHLLLTVLMARMVLEAKCLDKAKAVME